MTWTPLMRGLLAVALLQVILGGGLAIGGVGDDGTLVDDREGEPAGEFPGSETTAVTPPGTPGDGTPPPGLPMPGAVTTQPPFIPPTASGGGAGPPKDQAALAIYSSYAALEPGAMGPMPPEAGYEVVIEGRRADRASWQLYAHKQASGNVCIRAMAWRADEGRGGGGGHAGDCPAPTEWGFSLSSDEETYIGVVGYAPTNAAHIFLVAKDDREGAVPGVHRADYGGVSFFVAYLKCGGPDVDRLEARDAAGVVLTSYGFDHMDVGMPSWHCEMNRKHS